MAVWICPIRLRLFNMAQAPKLHSLRLWNLGFASMKLEARGEPWKFSSLVRESEASHWACAFTTRHSLPYLRSRSRTESSGRWHLSFASCHERIGGTRSAPRARARRRHRDRHLLLQSLRAVHLQRSFWPVRGLRLSAVLHSSRRFADGAPRSLPRTRWRRPRRSAATSAFASISTRTRPLPTSSTPSQRKSYPAKRRRGHLLRRHPLDDSQTVLSERRTAALFRNQHVARRHALEALPHRRQHGAHRLVQYRQGSRLSDSQQYRRRRSPAHQLGRRHRDAQLQSPTATGAVPAASRISSTASPIGTLTGWTFRK